MTWSTPCYAVVGGSGFIGRYVVHLLAARGYRVKVGVRNLQPALFLKTAGQVGQVQLLETNVRMPATLDRLVEGCDGVVNLVGILNSSGAQTFEALHRSGAGAVAEAARKARARSLVQVSAIGADARSASRYARSKAGGEAAVAAAFPKATILRPSIVFGPEDDFFNRFAALARSLPVMPVVCGDTRFQPVYVGDVARAIVASLEAPDRYGGHSYELGGPSVYSFRALLQLILRETRLRRPLLEIPLPVARLQAAIMSLLPRPMLTVDQLILLQRDNVVQAGAPGLDDFDIQPTPVEAIVPGYLIAYRPQGQFNRRAA